jgi:hypothetical protein
MTNPQPLDKIGGLAWGRSDGLSQRGGSIAGRTQPDRQIAATAQQRRFVRHSADRQHVCGGVGGVGDQGDVIEHCVSDTARPGAMVELLTACRHAETDTGA